MGFCLWDYTPTRRGFDTHLGYWADGEGYFVKNKSDSQLSGLDFRNGTEAVLNDEYSTYIYGNETLRLLRQYVADDTEDPFFLYFASQAVHHPFDAPQHLLDHFEQRIGSGQRAKLAATTVALDDTVGLIVDYLKSAESGHLWDDTLFIVSSDNGGMVTSDDGGSATIGASNFPLRGGKTTLWEGGIRVIGYVTGGVLPDEQRGRSMDALMHISDWFPTLCSLAGVDYEGDGVQELDGFSQRDNILYGETDRYSPRELLVHNIKPGDCESEVCGAIRWRNWKIIGGSEADSTEESQSGWKNAVKDGDSYADTMTIQCTVGGDDHFNYPAVDYTLDCPYNGYPCLFDLDTDPCEYTDLRESEPAIYSKMYELLLHYNSTQKMPTLYSLHEEDYEGADPEQFDGFWSPWMEPMDSMDIELNEEVLDVVVSGEERRVIAMNIWCVWTVRAAVLVLATFAIKMLYDVWSQRRSYRTIEDKTENIGSSMN